MPSWQNVRVNIEEPEAKKAIRDVLINLKNVEGSEASADALQSLLDKTKGLPASKKAAAGKTPKAPTAGVKEAEEKLSFGYEQTPQKYKGIFKQRKDQKPEIEKNMQRQSSTAPDEMQRWRLEARSLRILEQLNESDQGARTLAACRRTCRRACRRACCGPARLRLTGVCVLDAVPPRRLSCAQRSTRGPRRTSRGCR